MITQASSWMKDQSSKFFLYLGAGIVSLALIFYFIKNSGHSSYNDYLNAHIAFNKWTAHLNKENPSLDKLDGLFKTHPELHEKFDAVLVQTLIAQNRFEASSSLPDNVMNRIQNEVPYHALFAKTSLLISRGDLKNALADALSLKEKMQNVKECSVLNIYNLIRIASLYRSLDLHSEEYSSLNELETYLQLQFKKLPSATQNLLENSLKDKEISLLDYIRFRKAQISQG